eukprot:3725030-Prymnesium_polylepis.1
MENSATLAESPQNAAHRRVRSRCHVAVNGARACSCGGAAIVRLTAASSGKSTVTASAAATA